MTEEIRRMKEVPTQIKNPSLVKQRRRQIVDAAVQLFIKKGFHKTTTREIAGAANISNGLLYEYVRSKEDVLYLVCDAIHAEVENSVAEALRKVKGGRDVLAAMIREYFRVCHKMSDHILLIYQETKTLPPRWREKVLENEVRLTNIFVKVIGDLVASGELPHMNKRSIELVAHNIVVLGHMWTFRRWYLSSHYSIDRYIKLQTGFILGRATSKQNE
ncbi:MAG: TetR/AcrR family transcriptional regulator [Candidatus Aminicenantes bacterium]|nr:TetR/AcrR family transcriptional regulator [Candidatus Aminicenantes bacterium]